MDEQLMGLIRGVAVKLAGHDLQVRFQPPVFGEYACAFSDDKGGAIIDIMPDAPSDTDKFLNVLLHEVAHVKLHWDYMQGTDDISETHGAFKVDSPERDAYLKREREANAQMTKWKRYAEWNKHMYLPNTPKNYLARHLLALWEMPERPDGIHIGSALS